MRDKEKNQIYNINKLFPQKFLRRNLENRKEADNHNECIW